MILDQIVAATEKRVSVNKLKVSFEKIREMACSLPRGNSFPFEEAIKTETISFISEVKKASPSKGLIALDFPYLQIAKEYEAAGAQAVSVLTEPNYFLGSDLYLQEIKKEIQIPVLRKDFTIDPYQIYEAKTLSADAVLLICTLLSDTKLIEFMKICDDLGLSALVEAHSEEEVNRALNAGAKIIGVNNRNLQTFEVDFENCLRLRSIVGKNALFVAESGIKTADDVRMLQEAEVDGVLIGETFMRSDDKIKMLAHLRGED